MEQMPAGWACPLSDSSSAERGLEEPRAEGSLPADLGDAGVRRANTSSTERRAALRIAPVSYVAFQATMIASRPVTRFVAVQPTRSAELSSWCPSLRRLRVHAQKLIAW